MSPVKLTDGVGVKTKRIRSADEAGIGILCAIASFIAFCIYLFGYGNQPYSAESFFWAMPLISPATYLVYRRSKLLGWLLLAVVYGLATYGAYGLFRADCLKGNCFLQNKAAVIANAMVGGYHMMCLLLALVLASVGVIRSWIKSGS